MSGIEARRWMAWMVLVASLALVYASGLYGEFTYDDKVEVIGNRTIRILEDWHAILGYNVSRPLLITSYAINFRAAGFDPFTYHAVDLFLQMVNAGLVMLIVSEGAERLGMERPLKVGLVTAGIWALHPLATESVSYVTGRSEELCGTFVLLGAWFWIRWLSRRRWSLFIGAHLAFLAGMASKEVAVIFPFLCLLMEWALVARGRFAEIRWRGYGWFALLLGLGAFARWRVYGVLTFREWQRPLDVNLLTEAEVFWAYLRLTFLPVGQSVFHDYPETGLTLRSGAAALAVVASVVGALFAGRRWPVPVAAWLFFLLALAPSSLLPLKETMAEHRTYLALLGPAVVVGSWLSRRPMWMPVLVWIVLGSLTARRSALWSTEIGLWGNAVDQNPASSEAWYGLGDALRFANRCSEAVDAYSRVTELDPRSEDAWSNLGICWAATGAVERAEEVFKKGLSVRRGSCRLHTNLGILYVRTDRAIEGENELVASLNYCPKRCESHYWAGVLYQEALPDMEKAVQHFEYLLDLCPHFSRGPEVRERILELTF